MRFMVLMKATADSEAGRIPPREEFESMIAFNERLANDGILLAAEGLRASSKGTRLQFERGRTTVTDGPFAETKELVGAFWIVQCKSREEVVERFAQVPFARGEVIEIREFLEPEDFGDVFTADLRERAEHVTLPNTP